MDARLKIVPGSVLDYVPTVTGDSLMFALSLALITACPVARKPTMVADFIRTQTPVATSEDNTFHNQLKEQI